ncbi:MAG TPA: cupin domain-containing protein [Candidatus Binatia bacterium]|jgi:quercetin dioxygenase-like cupin family protein|nr:cupin domain-containing protein [Candidatus Binatia bacterium]
MRLPHRDRIDLGPSPYDRFLEREAIPVVKGYFVEDLKDLAVKPWKRMGALGCYLNMGGQQDTDAYVCEIPPGSQTLAQRHLYETLVYIVAGRGATTVWHDEKQKRTFEWSAGAIFAIPLNVSYQHFNVSNEPVKFLAGTNLPHLLNLFHNEDFIFRNPFEFTDRFDDDPDYFRKNERLTTRSWETNLVPDVNTFHLDEYPMKGKGVKIMRFGIAGTVYGCHIQEFPTGSRSLFHRHGPGAIVCVTQGTGYAMVWREEDKERTRFEIRPGSIYSPGDLMYHGHFNTGPTPMRHFAMRGRSPKYSQDRYRPTLHDMLPLDMEPPEVHPEYLAEIARNGITEAVSVVQE